MPAAVHRIPFPCAVYIRSPGQAARFLFSHFCEPAPIHKAFPCSLHARDVQAFHHARLADGGGAEPAMRRACFLVLVSGDTAQCVSVANACERRQPFLFRGSRYDARGPVSPAPAYPSEFHADYVPVHLSSTLAVFERHRLTAVADVECGLALFPVAIQERDIRWLAAWMDRLITKAARTSTWVSAETLLAYDETTLSLRAANRKRPRETEPGPKQRHERRCSKSKV